MSLKLLLSVIRLLALRPGLWPTAFSQWFRLAESRWWKRPPFFPTPNQDLFEFRIKTQYGTLETKIEALDVLTWLIWVKEFQKIES
ncbi:MAG TPA: hypothetical protein QF762_04050 [Acidimicrobiales bacterium]|nr:hypothetical protein [Acidimicrobiales bacterium]